MDQIAFGVTGLLLAVVLALALLGILWALPVILPLFGH
jgi:hypothetical protein